MIASDDVVSVDLTEGVIIEDCGCVDAGEGCQVPDNVGQDITRGPHLDQVVPLAGAQVGPAPDVPRGGGDSRQAQLERERFDHLYMGHIKNKIRGRALLYHSVQLTTNLKSYD